MENISISNMESVSPQKHQFPQLASPSFMESIKN
jgi:hypothetical protein